MRHLIPILACGFLLPLAARAQQMLSPEAHHLRNTEQREWNHYPASAEARELSLSFDLAQPETYRLLTLRQAGLKQTWTITLNDKKIGALDRDQADMEIARAVPAGILKATGNTLVIATKSTAPDDIHVGEIALHAQDHDELTSGSRLSISVTDVDSGSPLPCRLTIVNAERNTLVLLGASSTDRLAVRAGVIYTLDGRAETGLRPGRYRIWAGRGFEYSLSETTVELGAQDSKEIALQLRREVPTPGLVSCDTHLHTLEFARHGDASLVERLITLAGEGIELPISTEHNQHIDYAPEARRIGADPFFTPVVGCEVTTSEGHFNSFPIEPGATPAETKLRPWPGVFRGIYDTPGVKVVILNHPRDLHSGFRPFDSAHFDDDAGKFTDGRVLEANAMEVINSGAQQSDPMQLVRDWFALLRSGHRIAAVGSSDSHTVNYAIPGQARTYVPCPDEDPSGIDVAAAVEAFLEGKTHVSFGLLTTLEQTGDGRVRVRILGPGWAVAIRLTLYRDGEAVGTVAIPPPIGAIPGLKYETSWKIADLALEKGSFLVAVAEGPGIDAPWWPMKVPYQPTSPEYKSYIMGISPAIWPVGRE